MANLKLSVLRGESALFTLGYDVKGTELKTAVLEIAPMPDLPEVRYTVSLKGLTMLNEMYHPTEIVAKIVFQTEGDGSWVPIGKDIVAELLLGKEVWISEYGALEEYDFGTSFYVNEVLPHYSKDSMTVTLKIYSPDKQMTLNKGCMAYVAKKLGADVMNQAVSQHYNHSIESDFSRMKILMYKRSEKDAPAEHIFPYLVQYNESIYDLLARTANRWGEFFYYEDNKLHIGYEGADTTEVNDWTGLDYCNLTAPLNADSQMGTYEPEVARENHVENAVLKKSPDKFSGNWMADIDHNLDITVMKTLSSVINNTQSIPEFIGSAAFDHAWDIGMAHYMHKLVNDGFNGIYFAKPDNSGQYNESKDRYNQFTELDTTYDQKRYIDILSKEQTAGQDAVCIDFDTTNPKLRLGQIIQVIGKKYIVVKTEFANGMFKVVATPQNDDNQFYPTILPSGHIRTSEPQIATVFDSNDPLNKNRVRVRFSWQKETDDEGATASPWLPYATSGANESNGLVTKHFAGDKVFVNFANGNVENPYVVGGLSMRGNKRDNTVVEKEIWLESPSGHGLKFDDGANTGLTSFLTGILFPFYSILTFIPGVAGKDLFEIAGGKKKILRRFEGGFELSDKYGVYKISGSTNGRNVTVSSPWGDVAINAFTGISISAPNGDVSISGKNVTIEAGNNLQLISGGNVGNALVIKKDTKLGSLGANAVAIGKAIAKKVAQRAQIFDMSFIRSCVEVYMRPMEGSLTVKSSRYLKLEAGMGECSYPKEAYTNETLKKLDDTRAEAILKGLDTGAGILELLDKISELSKEVAKSFAERYKKCRNLLYGEDGLNKLIEEAKRYADDGNSVCKSYEDLKVDLWKKEYTKIKEDDLGFKDNFKVDQLGEFSSDLLNLFSTINIKEKPDQVKFLISKRKDYRKRIVAAANALHKAISELQSMPLNGVDITTKVGRFEAKAVPSNYKECLRKAFSADNMKDVCTLYNFDLAKGNLKKRLNDLDQIPIESLMMVQGKIMKRKAFIAFLEELGFKDEWRKNDNGNTPTRDEVIQNIGVTDDNDKWPEYVNSIKAVPLINALESKFMRGLKFVGSVLAEQVGGDDILAMHRTRLENHSWSNGENGSILFDDGRGTYKLQQSPEKIESLPNGMEKAGENEDLKKFITELRKKLS